MTSSGIGTERDPPGKRNRSKFGSSPDPLSWASETFTDFLPFFPSFPPFLPSRKEFMSNAVMFLVMAWAMFGQLVGNSTGI